MIFCKDWRPTFPEVELKQEQNRFCYTVHASSGGAHWLHSILIKSLDLSVVSIGRDDSADCEEYWVAVFFHKTNTVHLETGQSSRVAVKKAASWYCLWVNTQLRQAPGSKRLNFNLQWSRTVKTVLWIGKGVISCLIPRKNMEEKHL